MNPLPALTLILTTFPSEAEATTAATMLVNEHLCACVSIVPKITSIYIWNGTLHSEMEVQVLIKTSPSRVTDLVKRLTSVHPYDVPEILVLPISEGNSDYFDWVTSACSIPTGHANDSSA